MAREPHHDCKYLNNIVDFRSYQTYVNVPTLAVGESSTTCTVTERFSSGTSGGTIEPDAGSEASRTDVTSACSVSTVKVVVRVHWPVSWEMVNVEVVPLVSMTSTPSIKIGR